jgi:hypothetical protein
MKQKMHGDIYQQMKTMDQKYGDMSYKKYTAKDHAKMTKNCQSFKNMRVEDFFEEDEMMDIQEEI